jgi:hypothetical protein
MSRYFNWTNAWSGIATYIHNINPKLNSDRIINEYSRSMRIKGSFSERCLQIGNNFKEIKKYIDKKYKLNHGK